MDYLPMILAAAALLVAVAALATAIWTRKVVKHPEYAARREAELTAKALEAQKAWRETTEQLKAIRAARGAAEEMPKL